MAERTLEEALGLAAETPSSEQSLEEALGPSTQAETRPRTLGGHIAADYQAAQEAMKWAPMTIGSQTIPNPVSGLVGGLMALLSPLTGGAKYGADIVGGNIAEYLAPKIGPTPAAIAGTTVGTPLEFLLSGGGSLAQQVPGLATKLSLPGMFAKSGQVATRTPLSMMGVTQPIREAEAMEQANRVANMAERIAYDTKVSEWTIQQQNALDLGQLISKPGVKPLERISPLAESVKPNLTPREAYSFLEAIKDPPIPYTYPNTSSTSISLASEATGQLKALRSTKMQSILDELKAKSATGEMSLDDLSKLTGFRQSDELGAFYLQQAAKALGSQASSVPLRDFSKIMSGVGQLVDSPSSEISRSASRIYRSMKADLAQLGPAGDLLLNAQAVARRSKASNEMADHIFKFGSSADRTGNLKIAESLDKLFAKDKYLRESFPLEDRFKIQEAIQKVFHISEFAQGKKPPTMKKLLPEIIDPRRAEGLIARHPFIVGGVASSLFNLKHGIGVGLTLVLPRLIFRGLTTAPGRSFLTALYADTPPNVTDIARYTALANFLQSQGEPLGPEELKPIQDAQQQAAQQAQQQQQAQMLPLLQMMMQGQGQGKSR